MHDPSTIAFDITYPWRSDPCSFAPKGYRKTLITIWHKDPEKDGSDDSCGWFKRARHGNPEVLEKIVSRFDFDWDRVFKSESGNSYFCGLFCPNGDPHLSVLAIGLNLFYTAAIEVMGRKKAVKFCQENLFEILLFTENPFDSLSDSITQKFKDAVDKHPERARKERIHNIASIIYGYILRETQPWWKHPRWHVHHWRIQIHPLQKLNRWLFKRCSKCGLRLGWNESAMGNWHGSEIYHSRCYENMDSKPA